MDYSTDYALKLKNMEVTLSQKMEHIELDVG